MRAILNCLNTLGKTYSDGLVYNESILHYVLSPVALNDADGGGSTGWSFEVTSTFSGRQTVNGTQTFYDPNAHTEGWVFYSGTPQTKWTGLDNAKTYTIKVTADNGIVSYTTKCDITIAGTTKTVDAWSSAPVQDHQAVFTGVSPTANEIVADFSNFVNAGYIVAFEIEEEVAGVSANIGTTSETTSTFSITPEISLAVNIGVAAESDTSLTVLPITPVSANIGTTSEVVTTFSVTPNLSIPVSVGVALESVSTFSITPETPSVPTIPQADIDRIVARVLSYIVESTETLQDQLRLLRSESLGKLEVDGSTITFRDAADTKDRVVAGVDTNGQRISIITDPT